LYDKGAPSIEEMRHMVSRPDANSLEFYPLVTVERECVLCGTVKPEWWIIVNGDRYCCKCSSLSRCVFSLPPSLNHESGMPGIGVAIWRKGKPAYYEKESVGIFLSRPENQSGDWYIDGGWGGPPGPIVVRWDGSEWIYGGFCGHDLPDGPLKC
jgi:hypothetical protein